MDNADRPKGPLMTGAIGSFMIAAGLLIFFFTARQLLIMAMGGGMGGMGREDSDTAGAMFLVTLALTGVGGILAMVGFGGLGKIYGSTNMVGGLFALVLGIGCFVLVISGFAHSPGILKVSLYLILGGFALSGIFGGIGQLATTAVGKIAGIVLLIGGILWAWFFVGIFVPGVLEPLASIIDIYLMALVLAPAAGFLLSGVSMLSARSA